MSTPDLLLFHNYKIWSILLNTLCMMVELSQYLKHWYCCSWKKYLFIMSAIIKNITTSQYLLWNIIQLYSNAVCFIIFINLTLSSEPASRSITTFIKSFQKINKILAKANFHIIIPEIVDYAMYTISTRI